MMPWPNMLLVAGSGRNVGKTTFVCKIIGNISKQHTVVALKISPHFHGLCNTCKVLFKSGGIIISQELADNTGKDSSKMLKAGAKKVFYIQVADYNMERVLILLEPFLPKNSAIICESAALRKVVNPGIFVLMLVSANTVLNKKNENYIKIADRHIFDYNYQTEDYIFEMGMWKLNSTLKGSRSFG